MRELDIVIDDELKTSIEGVMYDNSDVIFLGYAGENDATILNIYLHDDFDGYTYYLLWDGEEYGDVTEYTCDADDAINLEYDVPSDYTTKAIHTLRIELHSGDDVLLTTKMYFEIK